MDIINIFNQRYHKVKIKDTFKNFYRLEEIKAKIIKSSKKMVDLIQCQVIIFLHLCTKINKLKSKIL
jgi:hypothetical protein